MKTSPALRLIVALAAALGSASAAQASGTIAVTYYVVPEHHPDVDHGIDGSTVVGLVAKHLGPHGLPVATAFARTKGGPSSGPIHDVDRDGEILWWSTASRYGVRVDATGQVKLPLTMDAMFPMGHADDTDGFRTAHFRGTFTGGPRKAGVAGISLGSDDDAWVFVDGELRVDNGGVKAMTFTPYSLGHLSSGTHTIDIFYADRYGSNAAIQIDSPLAMSPAALGAPKAHAPSGLGRPSLTAAQMRAELARTGRFTLRDIHFAFDKTEITHDSGAVLGEVGKVLRGDPTLRLSIEGHTDNAGDAAYNQDLSQRRAAAVEAYLVAHAHVAASRLSAVGFGAAHPVATNATAKGRALNRRVEFVKR